MPRAAHSAATASLHTVRAGPCGASGARSMPRITSRTLRSCGAKQLTTWRNSMKAQSCVHWTR
eukprot:11557664-Alexandrium_andersonii.AAC.1